LLLAAAALTKYVAAPLFLLDFLVSYKTGGSLVASLKAYVPRALVVAGLCVLVFAPFYRSPNFFDATLGMSFGFFRPIHALRAVLGELGGPFGGAIPALRVLLIALFPAIAAWHLFRYFTRPDVGRLRVAALSIVVAMIFSAVGHIWPWFLLWGLPFVALAPRAPLARWYVGVAIGFQFLLPVWQVYAVEDRVLVFRTAVLLAYLLGFVWLWLAGRFLPPEPALAEEHAYP
jgi:hypothetical protein